MPPPKTTHTVFEYLYRDASNYKAFGELLLRGVHSKDDATQIMGCCASSEFFVAERLGIPTLYAELWESSDGPNDDDHTWHEFIGLREPSKDEQTTLHEWGTLAELLSRFRSFPTRD